MKLYHTGSKVTSSELYLMGAYLNDNVFADYGWIRRDCSETLARVMCRLDCSDSDTDDTPDTTEAQTTMAAMTTHETSTIVQGTQRLAYTVYMVV